MRIWTLNPKYLDAKGLVALWRETLLAQAVLAGRTKGYRNHPQLDRFRASEEPLRMVRLYLLMVCAEAKRRGYSFDESRIDGYEELSAEPVQARLTARRGQLDYEWQLLMHKLSTRSPETHKANLGVNRPTPHPLFRIVAGPIEEWERVKELDSPVPAP